MRSCVYDMDHIYALRIENTSESTVMKQLKQLQRKPRKKSEVSTMRVLEERVVE